MLWNVEVKEAFLAENRWKISSATNLNWQIYPYDKPYSPITKSPIQSSPGQIQDPNIKIDLDWIWTI